MKRIFFKLVVLGCLGVSLLGSPAAAGAQSLGDTTAHCPTHLAPYAMSSACIQALSERSVREAAQFAPPTATIGQADAQTVALECPAATFPYGISYECAQALSHRDAQQALAFASAALARANQGLEQ